MSVKIFYQTISAFREQVLALAKTKLLMLYKVLYWALETKSFDVNDLFFDSL